MRSKIKRGLNVYKLALSAEIHSDELAMELSGMINVIDYNLIRVYKTEAWARMHPQLTKYALYSLAFAWPFVFFIKTTLSMLFLLLNLLFKEKSAFTSKQAVLLLTPRIVEQVKKVSNESVPELYLSLKRVDNNPYICPISNFYTTKIILKSYWASLLTGRLIKKLKVNYLYRMQSYTAYDWFLTWFTLNTLKLEEIWFGNHYDRWAVLCEYLPVKRKIFVQHGIEDGKMHPIVKFNSISKAFLINKEQKQYFDMTIFSKKFDTEYLNGNLCLTNITTDNASLLIVANIVLSFEKEKVLIERLQNKNIDLYLKPHPVFSKRKYYKLLKHYNFHLIEAVNMYPKVDIVVSYESTLGLEYEQAGIKVLYYSNYSLEEMVSEILHRIEGQRQLKLSRFIN